MSLSERIMNLPEQYIYIVLAILFIWPLLSPIGLPLTIEDITETYYEGIEAIPPGSIIFATHDGFSGTEPEIGLSCNIVLKHLFRKEGIKIVFAVIGAEGPPLFFESLEKTGLYDKFKAGYGTDYVYLPYVAGEEAAAAAISASIRGATGGIDYEGTNLDELPLMKNIDSGADFDVVVCLNEPGHNSVFWMNQVAVPNNLDLYANPLAAVAGGYWPYVDAGQMKAMLIGAKGAAGYELLMRDPGPAAANMDAQSLSHLFLAILVVVTNIVHLIKKGGIG